jgi:beta-xylosidase
MNTRPILLLLFCFSSLFAQNWTPDLKNGRYKNPIIFADYSDPDIIRVGNDFYMVASSFNCMPGIPVLHSQDLVNWKIINHVYNKLPFEKFDKPAHGQGSWAPSMRYHNGKFYVYFCTPQEGLFMAETNDPAGKWKLNHVVNVALWEDPCPFWDDDGNAYLVRSKLRAGILYLHKMSKDGKKILDNGTIIFQDEKNQPTIEGPKFLKKDGYYYIFAPAGGVKTGWQTVLRSKNIYGPYESKIIMQQGSTDVNGPHQGGFVKLTSGEWWFAHFQDKGAYGRIVHLQPMKWQNDWPIIGNENGEPVKEANKPNVGITSEISSPQTTDEFDSAKLGLQWQWQANPVNSWFSLKTKPGYLRLYAVKNFTQNGNLYFVPNLLLQKFSAPSFTVKAKIDFKPELTGEKSGIVIMGKEWAYIALEKSADGIQIGMYKGSYLEGYDNSERIESHNLDVNSCFLKVQVNDNAVCSFYYSTDNVTYRKIGNDFTAQPGVWIGAKVGLFCLNPNINVSRGYADFDWFRFE